jgi:PAS domain S-box-containing protein
MWTDNIVQGLRTAIGARKDVSLHIEYLDFWNYGNADQVRIFQEYLSAKYRGVPLDLAVVADDAALELFTRMRADVFSGVPLVCCGVNNLDPDRLARLGDATGVNEAMDILGTLDVARRLFPAAKRLVVLAADHGLGKINLDIFWNAYKKWPDPLEVREVLNLSPGSAREVLATIPEDAVALRLSSLEDLGGATMNRQESMELVSRWTKAPVFTCWDFDMGYGALGGRVVSASSQGRTAGELVRRILDGEKAGDIPPVMDSPNTVMLDFTQLERFNAPMSRVPEGAVVINRPFSAYDRYKGVIWSTGAALVLMSVCIVWLLAALAAKRKAEGALRAQRDFMDTLLETIPIPIFYKDQHGVYARCNKAFQLFSGKSRSDIIGKTVHDTSPPELAAKYAAMDRDLMEHGGRQRYEWKYRDDRGELRDVVFDKAVIRDETGEIAGIIGVISDITDRVRMEQALRKGEERFRTLVEHAGDAIYLTDMDGRFLEVNPEAQRQTGFGREELLGMCVSDLDVNMPVANFREFIASLRPGGKVMFETMHRTKDGGQLPVELRVAQVTSQGRPMLLGIARDVSARKRDEAALHLAKEMADDASKAKSEFLAVMSHEIRTPLNGVMGMLQLVKTTALNPEQRECIETAISCSRNLLRILSDILDISRIEAGKYQLVMEEFSLEDVLRPVMEVFAKEAREKGLDFSSRTDPALSGRLIGDPGRIRQIAFNLLGNAVKYTEQGAVLFETSLLPYCPIKDGVCLHMTVTDTGIGIPDDKLNAVFGLFTQVENAYTRKYGGSGLGLAIVRRLAHLMGGSLAIASEVGQGTQIHLSLPLRRAPLDVPAEQGASSSHPPLARSRKVLVVEDEKVNQATLMALLRKLGYEPTAADNGRMALMELARERYDGVLMDIQMPEMDGLETTRRIRETATDIFDPDIAVIAVTAHAMQGDRERFLAAGMQDYISKPVEMDTLRDVLAKRLPIAPGDAS